MTVRTTVGNLQTMSSSYQVYKYKRDSLNIPTMDVGEKSEKPPTFAERVDLFLACHAILS